MNNNWQAKRNGHIKWQGLLADQAEPLVAAVAATFASLLFLSGCSMQEELRRIEGARKLEQASARSRSDDLTGEEIFLRSCNTCHTQSRKGIGPRLEKVKEHYPDDASLIALIRKGKGVMPPQPKETINDSEMQSLVEYVRQLDIDLKEAAKQK